MTNQDKSINEIERDVAASRARLASTLDRIEKKLSPGELIDDAMMYFKNSEAANGAGEFGRKFARTMRDNPVPVTLTAASLGWLFWASTRSARPEYATESRQSHRDSNDGNRPRSDGRGSTPDKGSNGDQEIPGVHTARNPSGGSANTAPGVAGQVRTKAGDLAGAAQDKLQQGAEHIQDAASNARDKAVDALDDTQEGLHGAGEKIRRGAARARDGVAHAGEKVQKTYRSALEERPLALVAAAFAIGAAAAAVLPRTAKEDRYIGEHSDSLKTQAKETAKEQLKNVEAVAGAAYGAAKDEAENQGLTPSSAKEMGGKVTDKLSAVADAAIDASKKKAEEKDRAGRSSQSATSSKEEKTA